MLDIEQGIKALTALPGIGSWTASYIAMRAWSWPDVFLAGDYLIKQRFPGMTPRQIERYAERWRPWRSPRCTCGTTTVGRRKGRSEAHSG